MSNCPFEDLKARGFVYQSTDEEALKKTLAAGPVTYYVGFDPTGSSLHVGHLLPVMAMRRLQKAGHRPIALVGGATGLIGDPSGKREARPIITKEQVAYNVQCIAEQLKRFLPEDNVIMENNYNWLGDMLYLDFLRDVGSKFSVNRMLAAESVKMRMETGISFLEFSYMLLQSYDFVVLNKKYGCVLEMGGQDQWGNIVAGVELARKMNQAEVHGITMPLLINSATGEKFGKSAGELKGVHEVYGPKLILSEYYNENFYMEDRAIVRLQDLNDSWVVPYVKSMTTYPIDVVFNDEELEIIDRYKADFESAVSEQEALWLKNGGPTDEEWNAYVDMLINSCGMNKLAEAYQSAYDRYAGK